MALSVTEEIQSLFSGFFAPAFFKISLATSSPSLPASVAKERMEDILKEATGKTAVVSQVKRVPKKAAAPLLYDLTELQREASRRHMAAS